MTWYFSDAEVARQFLAFCTQRAIHGVVRREGPKFIITADVPRGGKTRFVSAWAAASMDAPWTRKPEPQRHFDFR
jgi:hypothetical protein